MVSTPTGLRCRSVQHDSVSASRPSWRLSGLSASPGETPLRSDQVGVMIRGWVGAGSLVWCWCLVKY